MMSLSASNTMLVLLALVATAAIRPVTAFAPGLLSLKRPAFVVKAGGFEWDDPEEVLDQGVDNPFKNPELSTKQQQQSSSSSKSSTETAEGMKIDPARLLGPRLSGSNLYLIGIMGTGKSAVGDIVARRK